MLKKLGMLRMIEIETFVYLFSIWTPLDENVWTIYIGSQLFCCHAPLVLEKACATLHKNIEVFQFFFWSKTHRRRTHALLDFTPDPQEARLPFGNRWCYTIIIKQKLCSFERANLWNYWLELNIFLLTFLYRGRLYITQWHMSVLKLKKTPCINSKIENIIT